jgi:hypothetical protein
MDPSTGLGMVSRDLFLGSSRFHPTLLGQRERLSCMTCHGHIHVMCIRCLL